MKYLSVLLSSLFLICISAYYVNSQQTAGLDAISSISIKGDVTRVYVYIPSSNGFTLSGVSVDGSLFGGNSVSVDTSIFKLSYSNFPSYFFNYFDFDASFSQLNLNATANSISSLYMPTFIVEYEETNGQDGYQYGEDTVLGYVNLAKLDYTFTQVAKTLNDASGKPFKAYQITLSSTTKLFQMVFYISESSIDIGGSKLTSEQSKIDVLINGYYNTFTNPSTCSIDTEINSVCKSTGSSENPNSRLAITSFFASANLAIDINIKGSINIEGSDLNAGFSWVSNAEVNTNGVNKTVNIFANVTAGNVAGTIFGSASVNTALTGTISHQLLIHSFDAIRPANVLWDPSMGVSGTADTNTSSTIIYSLSLVLSFVLFVLLI